jgi:hypothetical protein
MVYNADVHDDKTTKEMGIIQRHTIQRQRNAQSSTFPTGTDTDSATSHMQDAQQQILELTKVHGAPVTHRSLLVHPDANATQLLYLYKSLSSIPKPAQTSCMETSCDSGGVEYGGKPSNANTGGAGGLYAIEGPTPCNGASQSIISNSWGC